MTSAPADLDSDHGEDALLAAYWDGRLDAAAQAALDRRLASEPPLARRLAGLLLLDLDLHRLASAAPADLSPVAPVGAPTAGGPRRRGPAAISDAQRPAPGSRRPTAHPAAQAQRRRWAWTCGALAAGAIAAVLVTWTPRTAAVDSGGPVTVTVAAGGDAAIDGRPGIPSVLAVGETLRTSAAATLRWRDRITTAALAPGTSVRLTADGLDLVAGALEAEVAPRATAFRVTAGTATATVLGTRFRLSRWPAQTVLTVQTGRVELRAGDSAAVVEAGRSAIADVSGVAVAELGRGLLARWSGDGLDGGRLRDLSDHGHDAAASGVTVVPGSGHAALRFAGAASRVDIPHHGELDVGDPQRPFTVALWLRTLPGNRSVQNLLAKGRNGDTPGATLGIALELTGKGPAIYRWSDSPLPGSPRLESSAWDVDVTDGAWHHVAVVCERADLRRCYRDGVAIGSDATAWRNRTANRSRWTLGRLENQGFTGEFPFTGDLADVRLYDRVLTPGEVATLADRRP